MKILLKQLSVFSILLLISFNYVLASSLDEVDVCEGPSNVVEVFSKLVSESPTVYSYRIKNNYSAAVMSIKFGDSNKMEMLIASEHTPKKIESPDGWRGLQIFKHESEYMHIFWSPKKKTYRIKSGESLTDFKLTVSDTFKTARLLNKTIARMDGTPSKFIDFSKVPFRINFDDYKCFWGRARPVSE
jgi:hypothetical protein